MVKEIIILYHGCCDTSILLAALLLQRMLGVFNFS